jgi:hypothetical protein
MKKKEKIRKKRERIRKLKLRNESIIFRRNDKNKMIYETAERVL